MIQYLDKKNRLLFVSKGIGDRYGTFYRKVKNRGMHRLKSPDLLMRESRNDAENDLTWYAINHDLVPVTVSHENEEIQNSKFNIQNSK